MAIADRANRHEMGRVISAGHKVAMPGTDSERAVRRLGHPQSPALFFDLISAWSEGRRLVKSGCRCMEIPRSGQPVLAVWPEFGRSKMSGVIYADITARQAVKRRNAPKTCHAAPTRPRQAQAPECLACWSTPAGPGLLKRVGLAAMVAVLPVSSMQSSVFAWATSLVPMLMAASDFLLSTMGQPGLSTACR